MAATTALPSQSAGVPLDWGVTPERVAELVRRIAAAIRPLRIVQFGSRARGDHRPESDLDLAVILDEYSNTTQAGQVYGLQSGLSMSVDILTATSERHQYFAASINSVHYDIAHEGIILYERGPAMDPQVALMLRKAKDDRAALDLPVADSIFGFHAQQAIEKLLKALIGSRNVRYPRTHNLEDLFRQATSIGFEQLPPYSSYEQLQKFAVDLRYDEGEPLSDMEREAVRQQVDELRAYVEGAISKLL